MQYFRRSFPIDRLPSGVDTALLEGTLEIGASFEVQREARFRERAVTLMTDASRVMLVAILGYLLFFHLSVVRGSSMMPGIMDGDRILVEPWSYLIDEIDHGDVIVMQYPLNPDVDYIKRVIGLPGDRVTVGHGYVWVNGVLLDEPYVDDTDLRSYQECIVEVDHYFVLGDNRPRSSDSREFGQVHARFVRGRVDVRLWPLSRIGFVN